MAGDKLRKREIILFFQTLFFHGRASADTFLQGYLEDILENGFEGSTRVSKVIYPCFRGSLLLLCRVVGLTEAMLSAERTYTVENCRYAPNPYWLACI